MSHANARLTVHGRAELVRRVVEEGRPVAHVVAELGLSASALRQRCSRPRRRLIAAVQADALGLVAVQPGVRHYEAVTA